MNSSSVDVLANKNGPAEAANTVAPLMKQPTWEQTEGNPLPLGVNWIEEEQAFNFAIYSEHAESVSLLLYSPADLLHVRGFTKNPNSVDASRAGSFAGLVEKIPYLKELGVTVAELMPVFQRDPQEGDYWGYMPLNFFTPHAQ